MRQYKFRGETRKSEFYDAGKIVYGSSLSYFMGEDYPQIGDETPQGESIPVKPDSIRQLIAVDKAGNEIYEGDEIISRFGATCLANFRHYGGILDKSRERRTFAKRIRERQKDWSTITRGYLAIMPPNT